MDAQTIGTIGGGERGDAVLVTMTEDEDGYHVYVDWNQDLGRPEVTVHVLDSEVFS